MIGKVHCRAQVCAGSAAGPQGPDWCQLCRLASDRQGPLSGGRAMRQGLPKKSLEMSSKKIEKLIICIAAALRCKL